MATSVVRFQPKAGPSSNPPQWGVLFDRRIAVLATQAATTGEFVRHAQAQARAATREQATLSLDDVKLLSPVTTNQQFICQGVNYESHVRESVLTQ
jgi:2-keto-4-pentenoate hydratase/2-oxohepta-3-ene-1,7-dioic acid hydratase in catechol pathway